MNEFLVSYNRLNALKQSDFTTYTNNLNTGYKKLESMYSELNTNIFLKDIWSNIMGDYDNVMKLRDSIDNWWSNYLENLLQIEKNLPNKSLDIGQIASPSKYYVDHSAYISSD
ncbi:MAG: hypothetical protein J6O62_00265 [Bacilli bacterium]|nr:hypothetical protein [Bacilli bacterium]